MTSAPIRNGSLTAEGGREAGIWRGKPRNERAGASSGLRPVS
ncbi:hypothetical protein GGP97_002224 [Salinibacter ruber]|nr:hypothetical protein [Salinibacter ruber]